MSSGKHVLLNVIAASAFIISFDRDSIFLMIPPMVGTFPQHTKFFFRYFKRQDDVVTGVVLPWLPLARPSS